MKADGSYVHENLPPTLTDTGGGRLAWQAKLYNEGPDSKYFAYYPYRQTIGGAVQIADDFYWSGAEFDTNLAWRVNFADGSVSYVNKRSSSHRMRPVLAF